MIVTVLTYRRIHNFVATYFLCPPTHLTPVQSASQRRCTKTFQSGHPALPSHLIMRVI